VREIITVAVVNPCGTAPYLSHKLCIPSTVSDI